MPHIWIQMYFFYNQKQCHFSLGATMLFFTFRRHFTRVKYTLGGQRNEMENYGKLVPMDQRLSGLFPRIFPNVIIYQHELGIIRNLYFKGWIWAKFSFSHWKLSCNWLLAHGNEQNKERKVRTFLFIKG